MGSSPKSPHLYLFLKSSSTYYFLLILPSNKLYIYTPQKGYYPNENLKN